MRIDSKLGTRFAETHPDDASRVLKSLTAAEAAAFIEGIPAAVSAGLLQRISQTLAADCLGTLNGEQAAEIVANLPLDVAAVLLRRMRPAAVEAVLNKAPEPVFKSLARLLQFPEGTAGSLTDPQVLVLPDDASIADAQKLLRRSAAYARYNVYVVDRQQRLVGVLNIRALLQARPKEAVKSVMRSDVVHLKARTDLAVAANHPAWLEFDALPVVDNSGLFLGVIRHKTLRQMFRPAAPDGQLAASLTILVSLTELYWRGLSGLLGGFALITEHQLAATQSEQRRVGDGA
jgi:magnesium transporter